MILSDENIRARLHAVHDFRDDVVFPVIERGKIVLYPMPEAADIERRMGPCSIDMALGRVITTIEPPLDGLPVNPLDLQDLKRIRYTPHDITEQPFALTPGMFVLGITDELIAMPVDLVGFVRDKSRFARLGMTICLNSPKVDPGFHGTIALEINNRGPLTIQLRWKMLVCQLVFHISRLTC